MAMEKTFNAKDAEARIFKAWEDINAFAAGKNAKEGAEHFSIMIPPPNVTGALHIGHAFNNTLQDVLVRWHRMRGFDTLWQPGQDHAGIATQLQVEKMLAANGEPTRAEMGREAFTAKVWEWKEKYGSTIINQLKRLGASCDWDRNAFTMDQVFHDAVLKVFVDLYNKDLIYRGNVWSIGTRISKPRFPIWRSKTSKLTATCGISNIRWRVVRIMNTSKKMTTVT